MGLGSLASSYTVAQVIKANGRLYEKIKTKRFSNVLLRDAPATTEKLDTITTKESVKMSIWACNMVPKASWMVAWYLIGLLTKADLEAPVM